MDIFRLTFRFKNNFIWFKRPFLNAIIICAVQDNKSDEIPVIFFCNDGFRPVSFLLETLEEDAE